MEGSREGQQPKNRSIFDLPPGFFDSCRVLGLSASLSSSSVVPTWSKSSFGRESDGERDETVTASAEEEEREGEDGEGTGMTVMPAARWTCNTCKAEFDSLSEQRSHFKSDLHSLNVKLSIAGKKTVKEEDFDEAGGYDFEDFDVSSISGSEDEFEKCSISCSSAPGKGFGAKQKLHLQLCSGETISIYRSLILDESEDLPHENEKSGHVADTGCGSHVQEGALISRLKFLAHEPRDKKHLRIVLLVSGGHFAGCVFDGNSVLAHKTFHRYVVRAKAGKQQSTKDATGKAANSAGSSLRRHNEAALKKEVQELLVNWKLYIESASCIFVYAPARNRQMLFDVESPLSSAHSNAVRRIPLTVRRPTLKEARRVYNHLTHVAYVGEAESSLEISPSCDGDEGNKHLKPFKKKLGESSMISKASAQPSAAIEPSTSKGENMALSPSENETTPLHEAAKSGNAQLTLELLEQGLNPCIKDSRGRTPYMLASEKEVRNTFRRFMALNLDKWDWHSANVPSPLTKEFEEAQATKQAEKDAKRKAKAKELKKLRKEKEKAKAQAAQEHSASSVAASKGQGSTPASTVKQGPRRNGGISISTEEDRQRALAAEREKRAAAAERRIAALNTQPSSSAVAPQSNSALKGCADDVICSCCNASLAGKIPFHRYNYKYCSTTCMHVHREMLEDG